MEILGYIAAVLIGILLGMMGGGGSILTVPVLVYLLHVNPVAATTYSLFIVGATSLVGGTRSHTKKLVDFKAVTEFGIPSILAIFIARNFILPAIPKLLFSIGSLQITKDNLLMLVFAILMIFASFFMMVDKEKNNGEIINEKETNKIIPLVLWGLGIGFITGLLGAGGGFMIIPALVLFLKLPMKTAVGTSLVIIAINSTFGFLFSLKQHDFDWKILLLFTALSIVGIFLGSLFAEKVPGEKLKKWFSWFVLAMGICIIIKELFLR